MFDYLKCDYALPVPSELEGEEGFLVDELEFQTYSFSPPSMDEYEITEDGQLYRWSIKRFFTNKDGKLNLEEEKGDLLKLDHTGEVSFHGMHLSEKKDYFLEYKALFWKGDLKEMHLEDVTAEDNSLRVNAQEKLNSYVCKIENRKSRWWFPIFNVVKSSVMFINFCIRWSLGWGVKLTWKIDRWLSG